MSFIIARNQIENTNKLSEICNPLLQSFMRLFALIFQEITNFEREISYPCDL